MPVVPTGHLAAGEIESPSFENSLSSLLENHTNYSYSNFSVLRQPR